MNNSLHVILCSWHECYYIHKIVDDDKCLFFYHYLPLSLIHITEIKHDFVSDIERKMIELTVKTLDSRNHNFSVPDDVSILWSECAYHLIYCFACE